MGIFPEGTRSKKEEPPYLQRGKTGVARLAATFPDVPVHPIYAPRCSRDVDAWFEQISTKIPSHNVSWAFSNLERMDHSPQGRRHGYYCTEQPCGI